MSRKGAFEACAATSQQGDGASDRPHAAFDFRGPWMDTDTARAYTCKTSREAFRKWALRQGLQFRYCGARVLVAKADIDRAIGAAPRIVRKRA